MIIDTKHSIEAFRNMPKSPSLPTISVQLSLIYTSKELVNAPIEFLVLFGVLGSFILIHSAWIAFIHKSQTNIDLHKD